LDIGYIYQVDDVVFGAQMIIGSDRKTMWTAFFLRLRRL